MTLQIIPAIDLMDGACVRLQQGDAMRKTKYDIAPEAIATAYERDGATRIHVVDLDGAFSGEPKNLDAIIRIRAATKARIEVGGGIRELNHIEALFAAGVDYAVIGTKALEDPSFLIGLVKEFGTRIIVGADARDGFISTRGWTTTSQIPAIPFLDKLRDTTGIATVIFTDIARDGMFNSPNYQALEEVLAIPGLNVIASGGVGTLEDLQALRKLNKPNLAGVIIGKALYDGRIVLRDAVAVGGVT